MSLGAVHSTVSSLKSCQTDIGTGMDIITNLALDLVESQEGAENADLKKLEDMMVDCARLDREINCFDEIVHHITTEARHQQYPEALFALSDRVRDQYTEAMSRLSDAELQNHDKVVSFKESIRSSIKQANSNVAEDMEEELDEDIAVTQSQVNFICPLTQVEMKNPVKNRKCCHYYDQEAALSMIKAKHDNRKKFRCPRVGCSNTDVRKEDLILDTMMKRMIQKKQNSKT
ncbi:E3 SUMO-protein ligase NSE2 [Hypomesus transpacificus]|uniref:E3 SUMO-protein ligase NSE2 n=1 Tax=Hypomesus transpacificus TaxID=137520 RepID=UPI001F0865FF|nr:E3 SUMO-protein ligase NSE2 [Hypomesus transpacificus]